MSDSHTPIDLAVLAHLNATLRDTVVAAIKRGPIWRASHKTDD